MAQDVKVNIEELKRFGSNLNVLADRITTSFNQAKSHLDRVSETWQDADNEHFREIFNRDAQEIHKIAQRMKEYNQFIIKKSQRLEEYYNTKMY